MSRPTITLTTDFGQADGYVAAVKGVILGLCPQARIVDVSHDIPPQAVRQAAYVLATITPYFSPGTIHLVVVDPDVGSERREIAVQTERAMFVAPDNGVLSLALAAEAVRMAVHLHRPDPGTTSATFHGRDVFAPAAAQLACGAGLRTMGDEVAADSLLTLAGLVPEKLADGSWLGQVLHVDRFGNLITTFKLAGPGGDQAAPGLAPGTRGVIRIGRQSGIRLRRTYGEARPGELLAYVGSSGYLEIAVRDGSAAARLGIGPGEPVVVQALT